MGVPIPEDITLIAGGVICALSQGALHPLHPQIMSLIALIGVLIGDGIMFFVGRRLGPKVTRVRGLKRIITKKVYCQIQAKVIKYGQKVLFVARFLPGLRAPIFIMAGVSHSVSYLRFILMDGMAAIISVPILVYLGYFFANDLEDILNYVKHSEIIIVAIIIIVIAVIIIYNRRKGKKANTNKENNQ